MGFCALKMGGVGAAGLLVGSALLLGGCDVPRFAADSTAGVIERAAPAINAHWDYDLAGAAAPGSILQLEGLLSVAPDNEVLMLQLARAYVGYSFGWVEDELDRADPMDFQRQDYLQTRARLMYLRARNWMFRYLSQEMDEGFDEARRGGLESLQHWLQEHCTEPEHAEPLFWAGFGWGSAINMSREDPEMIADLSFAQALIERSRELDPDYFHAGATTFLAVVKSSFSEALGGRPEEGRALFEEALERNGRHAHLTQLNYARTYAVITNNRELFETLLREIIDAPDQGNEVRLGYKIARRRARRRLSQVDDLFYE